jgi:hypothetical protein
MIGSRSSQMPFAGFRSRGARLVDGCATILGRGSAAVGARQAETLLPTIAALLALAVGIYVLVTTIAMVIHGWSAVPYWDQWDELILSPKQVFSPWLYSQHNEHRILFPRLLFAIDTFAFAETNKFDFFCNLALPLALAGLIVHVARRNVSGGLIETLWIAGILLTVLFSSMQYENFVWGFQVQFFGVQLAAVASIACLALGRGDWASLAAAIAFSAIAVYTLASGIIVPFLAIPVALWAGRSKAQIAVLGLAAVALLASYLHGYVPPSEHSNPLRTLLRPELPVYAAVELGNPFGQLLRGVHAAHYLYWDCAFGALGLALFAITTLVHLHRGRSIGRPELVFLGTAALTVGVAFLTALGRLKFGLNQALSSRYATPMLLFWLSLAMLAIIEVQRRRSDLQVHVTGLGLPIFRSWQARRLYGRLQLMAMGLSLPGLLALAYAQPKFVKAGLAIGAPRREAVAALLANVDDAEALAHVYPHLGALRLMAAQLRAQHLSIFADDWSRWLGTPLADHVQLAQLGQCQGAIDQVTRLPLAGRAQWRAGGWAWDKARRSAPDRIVIDDGAGRVVGYALSGFPPLEPGHDKHSGWRGDFTAPQTGSVTAYALLDRDRVACPLARWAQAR